MRVIGMDLGFGFCKVVSGEDTYIFPSIVGSGGDDILKVSGIKSPNIEKETVSVDGMRLLVGESAIKQALRTYSVRAKSWIDSLAYRALLCHALRLAGVGSESREVTIVTGLPVSHYRSYRDRLTHLIKESAGAEVEVKVTLQPLAKQNGVSITRTKAEFIKLLDQVEPGVDHSGLKGKALIAARRNTTPACRTGEVGPKSEDNTGAAQAGRPPQEQTATHQGPAEGCRRGTGRESEERRKTQLTLGVTGFYGAPA